MMGGKQVVQSEDLHLARWMMFVDGENLTARAQDVAANQKVVLTEGPHYRRDVFVWFPKILPRQRIMHPPGGTKLQEIAVRSYYYASARAAYDGLDAIHESLWKLGFQPVIFKRTADDSRKTKGVDVSITRDLLVHAFRDHYDVAVLIAGDGDYVPVIEEVKRAGKLVYGGFFGPGSGLNPKFRLACDEFWDVTEPFLRSWSSEPENAGDLRKEFRAYVNGSVKRPEVLDGLVQHLRDGSAPRDFLEMLNRHARESIHSDRRSYAREILRAAGMTW